MLLGFLHIPFPLVLVTSAFTTIGYGYQLFNLIKGGLSMETRRNKKKCKRCKKVSIGKQIFGFVLTVGNLGECKIPSAYAGLGGYSPANNNYILYKIAAD